MKITKANSKLQRPLMEKCTMLVGVGVFVHHERQIAAKKIEAADAAASLKGTREADARIVALNEDYKSQLQTTEATYGKMHNAGRRWCVRPSRAADRGEEDRSGGRRGEPQSDTRGRRAHRGAK